MNRREALEILGLGESFTPNELKKASLRLTKEHHTDLFENESEEVQKFHKDMIQKVNDAYYLLSGSNVRSSYTSSAYSSSVDIYSYQEKILKKMAIFLDGIKDGDLNIRISWEFLKKQRDILFSTSKEKIDEIYEECIINAKKLIVESFYSRHDISYLDVKENIINADDNIEEFYKQLDNIAAKYSKSAKFKKRIDDEIRSYRLYATCTDLFGNLFFKKARRL